MQELRQDIRVRRAGPHDAEALAEIGRDTFVETFAHLYAPEDLRAFLAESYAVEAFAERLADPAQAIWVAEGDDGVLGYAHAGPCGLPHAEVTPGCGELKRLYVRAAAQNLGLGRRLMDAALEWLEAPGRRLWIGVWSQNHGAQRFYGRYGFSKVGDYEFPVGKHRDHEFIFSR